ncbi:MAG: phosphatase PAP2 family protein, partial [Muribaculaceae bacterium]|nr:phosphatase PAP2 family protein [Muribaculaceae bacterium]
MIDYLIDLDTNVFLWFNSSHSPFWDVVMKMASGKIIWVGLYLALIYAIWRAYGWRTTLVMVLAAGAAVALADQISASLLRPIFERMRPANPDNPISPLVHIVDGYRAGRYGFPSSHAANTFAVATLMSLLFKQPRFTIAIFLWALLNCYSRIYLGVHYPGDLLFGMTIGLIIGWIIYGVARWILRGWRMSRFDGQDDRPIEARLG